MGSSPKKTLTQGFKSKHFVNGGTPRNPGGGHERGKARKLRKICSQASFSDTTLGSTASKISRRRVREPGHLSTLYQQPLVEGYQGRARRGTLWAYYFGHAGTNGACWRTGVDFTESATQAYFYFRVDKIDPGVSEYNLSRSEKGRSSGVEDTMSHCPLEKQKNF